MTNKKKSATKGANQNLSNYNIILKELSKASSVKPVSVATLCAKTGITKKSLEEYITKMRKEGIFAAKKDAGYFIARGKKDKLNLVAYYQDRAEMYQATAEALRKNF